MDWVHTAAMLSEDMLMGCRTFFRWSQPEVAVLTQTQMAIAKCMMEGQTCDWICHEFSLYGHKQVRTILKRTFLGYVWRPGCTGKDSNLSDFDQYSLAKILRDRAMSFDCCKTYV